MAGVSTMNKIELRKAIEKMGEQPPEKWTRSELMSRLLQLLEERGETSVKSIGKTALQQGVIKLNQAGKKKSTLQKHVQELGCAVTGKETIAQLQRLGMTHLYQTTPPEASDPVGFGKGASLRYDEIKLDTQYCHWVMTQHREQQSDPQGTSCCPQLTRLAIWLEQEKKGGKQAPKPDVQMKVGYPEPDLKIGMKKETVKVETIPEESSSSSGPLNELVAVVKALQAEVQELKEDRPRRQKCTESTDSDYSMITTPEKP